MTFGRQLAAFVPGCQSGRSRAGFASPSTRLSSTDRGVSGTVLLAGDAHAGKTRFCAALNAAMQGPDALAGRKVMIGPVIYCALERPKREVTAVLRNALEGA